MQMVDLPADAEGLSWIADGNPTQLLLVPGLQASSIVAAAVGDQQALACVRFAAQYFAASAGTLTFTPLDTACIDASKAGGPGAHGNFLIALAEKDSQLAMVFGARQTHTREMLYDSAFAGELSALKWLRAICPQTTATPELRGRNLMECAAENGQLEVLKYLRSGPDPADWDEDVARVAAPHLDCIKWLLSTDAPGGPCPCADSTLHAIARHHGLPALQWLRANSGLPAGLWTDSLLITAALLGDKPMLEWLRGLAIPWSEWVTEAAARTALSILQWLRAQDPPCPWDAGMCMTAAASHGKLDILMWLRGQNPPCPWSEQCTKLAAELPTPQVLQWLHAKGCPFGPGTASSASLRKDPSMLKWLHSAGCPLESGCLRNAASLGNLPLLQWLCDQGCQLTGNLYLEAAQADHHHILRFLHRMKAPLHGADPNKRWRTYNCGTPSLMFCSDIDLQLPAEQQSRVKLARRAHCTFHGLVRWCKRAISDPSRGGHRAFDFRASDASGQLLLTRMCLLPPELVSKIAVAAGRQHDIFERAT